MQEQATETTENTPETGQQELSDVFKEALQEKQDTPQDVTESEETKEAEQVVDTPFLELVIGEQSKLPFKTEAEFEKFIESNEPLKKGWLRQSDYTRRTQEFAKQREEIEKQEAEFWGERAPDPDSKRTLGTLWKLYQTTDDPLIQDSIQKFVEDAVLIAQGKQALGPLKSVTGQTASTAQPSPEMLELRRTVMTLQKELSGYKSEMTQKQQNEKMRQGEELVDKWLDGKKTAKVTVTGEEMQVMADFMSILDEKGEPKLTLDQAYDLARHKMGKTKADVAKTVIQDAKNMDQKSGKPPSQKTSSTQEPEAKELGDILKQGMKSFA